MRKLISVFVVTLLVLAVAGLACAEVANPEWW